MRKVAKVLLIICVVALATTALAQGPNSFLYQGRLVDSDGNPITTQVSVVFEIFAASTGGSNIYTATHNVTPDDNGVFTQQLININTTVFNGSIRYMQLTVESDVLMPRQAIASAPYAYTAAYAGTANAVANNSISSASVVNSSLTDLDILDEPGISQAYTSGGITVASSGVTPIDSATINVPAAGYVLAMGHCYGTLGSGVGTTIGNILVGIETTSSTTPSSAHFAAFGYGSETFASNFYTWSSMSVMRTFAVNAGSVTYYFNASRGYSDGTASVNASKLTLLYIPTSYGTVETCVEAGSASDDNVIIIPADESPDQKTHVLKKVNLGKFEASEKVKNENNE